MAADEARSRRRGDGGTGLACLWVGRILPSERIRLHAILEEYELPNLDRAWEYVQSRLSASNHDARGVTDEFRWGGCSDAARLTNAIGKIRGMTFRVRRVPYLNDCSLCVPWASNGQ